MKIDLPVTIIFDCSGADPSSTARGAGRIVGTLRYDTDGNGGDAVLFGQYPPDERPIWAAGEYVTLQGEPASALLAFIPAAVDAKITAKAKRNPGEYIVGTDDEREAAQADADQTASDNSQFGVGA